MQRSTDIGIVLYKIISVSTRVSVHDGKSVARLKDTSDAIILQGMQACSVHVFAI